VEGLLVGPARLGGPAHLAHVLQRGGTHLIARRGRLEVVQLTDVSAHAPSLHRRRGSAHPLRTGCRPPPATNHLVAVGGVPEHGGMSSAAAPEHPTTPAETTLVLRVLTVATFVVILNETIMNNAIPRLMDHFSVPATSAQWLTTSFMLTMAVVIP